MPRFAIIVNPVSGRGAGEKAIPYIQQAMQSAGLDFDIQRTSRPWHAAELTQQAVAAGFDKVVGVGGDGTANEVINGLMLAKEAGLGRAAMGMLAVGRGNDFAFGMGIPLGLEAGCRALAQGEKRFIDVGRVAGGDYPQGRYFGNGVGIGFDAVVGFEALKMTRLSGFPSYIIAALKTIFLYYTAPVVRLEFDGQVITQPMLMVSIMNGRRMGGGFMMAPAARGDDGWFDLCIASQVSRARIFTLIPHFLRGTQAEQKPIRMARACFVRASALEGTLPAHADGETLCTHGSQLEIQILPAQIELIG
jgi:diacylglycerol kinase (ATP)